MTSVITCDAMFEPLPIMDGKAAIGIQLNFELRTPMSASDAEGRFRAFLQALPQTRFFLYKFVSDTLNLVEELMPIDAPPSDQSDAIMKWLMAADAEWENAEPTEDDETSSITPSRGQLLSGAQTWPAPLPQQAGLNRMLLAPKGLNNDEHYVVALQGLADGTDAPRKLTIKQQYPKFKSMLASAPNLAGDSDLLVNQLQPPVNVSGITPEGFLNLEAFGDEVRTLVDSLRHYAAGQFWVTPQLIALLPPIPLEPNAAYNAEARRKQSLLRLQGRASHGVASLLDTLLLSLTMPWDKPSTDKPFGEAHYVLGPIVQCVLGAAEDMTEEVEIGGDYTVVLRNYASQVRDWVDRLQKEEWDKFLETLATLLGRVSFKDDAVWTNPTTHQRDGKPILASLLLPPKHPEAPNEVIVPDEHFDFAGADSQLDQELAELVQQLGEEQGFEAAVLQFLRTASLPSGELLLTSLFKYNGTAPPDELETIKAKLNKFSARLIARISAYFASHYNALEAARQAVGRLVANAYLDAVRQSAPDSLPELMTGNWFEERTKARTEAKVDLLFYRLLKPLPDFDQTLDETDAAKLNEAWKEACDDLDITAAGDARRFVPDTHPADLSMLLPLPTQDQDDDLFGQLYDGIGLLVRRTSGDRATSWSQINRVRLELFGDTEIASSILPAQPAFEDGERSLNFEYCGHYFAFDTSSDPDGEGEGAKPFYEPKPPALNSGFNNPPSLAYGTRYDVAAFATSRNGILPKAVAAGDTVWERREPKGNLAQLTDIPLKTFAYSRKTGIGRAVLKSVKGAAAQKFDKDSVLPLAFDYPRIGLACRKDCSSWIDLWRREDGSGSILLPQADGEALPLKLNDFAKSDGSRVFVAISTAVVPDFSDDDFVDITDIKLANTVALKIERANNKISLLGKEYTDVDPDERGWIRLKLMANSVDAAISLADPAGDIEGNSRGDERDSKDFVLLRPKNPSKTDHQVWNNDFQDTANFDLMPPSMAAADLDRWLANPRLYTEASNGDIQNRLRELQKLLLAIAYDEGEEAAKMLREYSGFLPDLAVEKMQVELVVLDDIGQDYHGQAEAKCEIIGLPKLPSLIGDVKNIPLDELGYVQLDRLDGFLRDLFKQRTIDVSVTAGGLNLMIQPDSSRIKVAVPAGKVAQLRFRVAVNKSHYQGSLPVIDERLQQFAVGSLREGEVDYHLFDGPAIRIEVMGTPSADVDNKLTDLVKSQLKVVSAAGSRAYALECDPDGDAVWQWCGRAEIASQRWRHLGRPQTHWFDPSAVDSSQYKQQDCGVMQEETKARLPGPVVEIEQGRTDLNDFEQEAFDGRDNDVQRQTVRLSPLGEASVLHEGKWELPSATMFRHRVTLQNRYAPAMQQPTKKEHAARQWPVVAAMPDVRDFKPFLDWLRVVVLADHTRIRLTRPQLRALMPLPLSDTKGTCPPIMAMLAEPPFADGGLADRIAAGVATSIGYAMKKTTATSQQLGVDDTHQEFGPDPQLGYLPLATELNGAISLESAGPIGLTFDSEAGTSAAFPNSAWLLRPSAIADGDEHDFQEHFASVSLQRYLAPEWISLPTPELDKVYNFSLARWFKFGDDEVNLYCVSEVKGAFYCLDQEVLTVSKEKIPIGSKEIIRWRVTTSPQTILPEAPACNNKSIKMVEFDERKNKKCALLHQPLDDKRAAVSIFAVEPGHAPLLMASFQWIAVAQPKKIGLFSKDGKPVEGGLQTSASPVTDMEWTRTGRDIDRVAAINTTHPGDTEQIEIADLVINNGEFVDNKQGDKLWLRPSLHDTKVPLHLQRFLAVLPTYQAGGPGRAMQVYDPHKPVRPLFTPSLSSDLGDGLAQVHLLEIECPARPLGSIGITGIPPEYQKPTFDLRECGIEDKGYLLAMIRPSGTRKVLEGKDIVITFAGDSTDSSATITGDVVEMVILVIDRLGTAHKAWQIGRGGIASPLTIPSPNAISGNTISFTAACTEEWWGSVALLSLSVPELPKNVEELEVDFEWMFGPRLGEQQVELEASLSHKELRSTLAAQARIISISRAIKVR